MTALVYMLIVVLVATVAHWLLGARTEDACLAGVAWPAAGCLLMVLGAGAIAASPVLLGMWAWGRVSSRRNQRRE